MRQDSLISPPARPRDRSAGVALKVPFGLKDGRMWSPKQVAPGMACGCLCPACHAPLVAKAADSQHRRPHFAHLAEADCRAGYETALHLKAKQLLADHRALLLPAWDGEADLPNPPTAFDDAGDCLIGPRVEFPARRVALLTASVEEPRGDYIPDVIASDGQGELYIEVRVSHAVDALKRRRIQSEGRRLVEIDLSTLQPDLVSDEERLAHWVLDEASNRYWLSCPEATEAWRESHRALRQALAERNREIALARERQEAARQAELAQAAARQSNRERYREQIRAQYSRQLSDLPWLTAELRILALLREYETRDGVNADHLIDQLPSEAVKRAVSAFDLHGWIYRVHQPLWQAAGYYRFIHGQPAGAQFNQRDLARWVMQEYGKEAALYELFKAQYVARDRARKAGFHKRRIAHWAFTDEENRQIPDFYAPINKFVNRLVGAGCLEPVQGVIGQVRICVPGSAGTH